MCFAIDPPPLRGGGWGRGDTPHEIASLHYRSQRAFYAKRRVSPHPQPPPLKGRGLVERKQ
jgi:hypothetical protein